LFVHEPATDDVLELWTEADAVFCVTIGYLEMRSAIARRLRPRIADRARRRLDEYWQEVDTVTVDDRLVGLAAAVADLRRLRTFDALHLAAAREIEHVDLLFATWDVELAEAAVAEGLAVVP
jgi:predicted nucleic acid-binding protein